MSQTTFDAGQGIAPSPASGRGRGSGVIAVWPQLVAPLVLLALWEVSARMLDNRFYVPASEAASSLLDSLANERFVESVRYTLTGVLISYTICCVFTTIFGMFLGMHRYAAEVIGPILYGMNSIPKVTLYPIFLLVFGLEMDGRIAFSVFHGIFAGTILIMEATLNVSPIYRKIGASLRMNSFRSFRHIIVPAILPSLVSALRLMFGLCFIGMVVAELFSSYIGLGHELMRYIQLVQPERAFGLVILIFAVSIIPTLVLVSIERRVRRRYLAE